MRGFTRLTTFIALAVTLVGCEPDLGFNSPNHGTYFRVVPHSLSLAEGRSAALGVETDARVDTVFSIGWIASDWNLANIYYGEPGLSATVSAWSEGSTYIIAQHDIFGERRDSCALTILSVTPRTVEINPDSTEISIGESVQLWGTIRDSVGVGLYRPTGWEWFTSDNSVTYISGSDGTSSPTVRVRGLRAGKALITARFQGLETSGVILVR